MEQGAKVTGSSSRCALTGDTQFLGVLRAKSSYLSCLGARSGDRSRRGPPQSDLYDSLLF